jgi:hypothetical protein
MPASRASASISSNSAHPKPVAGVAMVVMAGRAKAEWFNMIVSLEKSGDGAVGIGSACHRCCVSMNPVLVTLAGTQIRWR